MQCGSVVSDLLDDDRPNPGHGIGRGRRLIRIGLGVNIFQQLTERIIDRGVVGLQLVPRLLFITVADALLRQRDQLKRGLFLHTAACAKKKPAFELGGLDGLNAVRVGRVGSIGR